MLARIARAYIYLILITETLSLAASVLLHVGASTGTFHTLTEHSGTVFAGALIAVFPALSLAKERNIWKNEFKDCAWWLHYLASASFVYALVIMILAIVTRSDGTPLANDVEASSAFMVMFNLMSLCIVYSILWSGNLTRSQLIQRARTSVLFTLAVGVFFFASYAGYLPQSNK
jgi:hypothetical protein